ncbi:AGZA family xanthine/uracil permease-like MFS transporter [Flexivirga oryzae]|uniref:AGZA family xanthine/uracil permease-like MFS transporter n=2 Tax=Flexivirga oryzae TaxID=1794944 RepID=A0A839N7X5_9MICO|nr:NCS2 family permease [Flexivirga oryzae]MBB2892869.1 AGZA family xanthine/uracil permease-like MFS transporter [Flexivirga oryzae]
MTTPAVAAGSLDRFFKITERGSTIAREIRGGFVTFFAMAYIIVLNPLIIGTVRDDGGHGHVLGGGTDPHLAKVAAATSLVAGVMTILMGAIANFPMAIATGLGLNAFVTFSIAALPGMTWADAMGLVVLEGIVMLVLVLSGFRVAAFKALPPPMKTAISVGIGLFITFVAFFDSGFIRAGAGTPVQLGVNGELNGWPLLVFCFGLILVIALYVRKLKGAILIAILVTTALAVIVEAMGRQGALTDKNPTGWGLNVPKLPSDWIATPDFGLVGHISLFGSFSKISVITALLLIFSLVLADFFDTMGTMVAIGSKADLLDKEGTPEGAQTILVVDSVAAAAGGLASVSSNTGYIESSAGVSEGARTGFASIVTGVLFLLSTFLSPVVAVVPYEAATPALVLVGFLMMQQVGGIDWHDWDIAIPAFLTIVLMPFSYSITVGIGAGCIAFVVVKVARSRARQVPPLMWLIAALFAIYFAIAPVQDILDRIF